MMCIFVLFTLLCLSSSQSLMREFVFLIRFIVRGINFLTQENLEFALESNYTVLAVWNGVECVKCAEDFWEVHDMLYAFEKEKNFYILANTMGVDETMDQRYKIDTTAERSVYRLFVRGSENPFVFEDGMDLKDWISEKTGLIPMENYVYHLSDATHEQFIRMTKKANAFFMIYTPQNNKCQKIRLTFSRVANAFHYVKTIKFAEVNCYETPGLCEFFSAPRVPAFRYSPFNATNFDKKQIRFEEGEDMVDYLNHELGTFIDIEGGLNTLYGRVDELDELAHRFMLSTTRKEKLQVMKHVAKLKNKYRAAYKYYKLMKILVREGEDAFQTEMKQIETALLSADLFSKEYQTQKAYDNIAHQFEVITFDHSVIELTPYNFDYVVNSKRNVMVLFYVDNCKPCDEFTPTFEEIAKNNTYDVVFAKMNSHIYESYILRYHLTAYPNMLWFAEGQDNKFPYLVNTGRKIEEIQAYIKEQFSAETTEGEPEL